MAGKLNNDVLALITRMVADVPGDFAEVGVYKGHLFKRLVPIAVAQGKTAHGFDSFRGMDKPTANDDGEYKEGHLSVGGIKRFTQILEDAYITNGFKLYEGFVPVCLKKLDPSVGFSFAYIDLDQYQPTAVALEWVHPLMATGGIIGLDDYFDKKCLASLAIKEFLDLHWRLYNVVRCADNQLFLCRRDRPVED